MITRLLKRSITDFFERFVGRYYLAICAVSLVITAAAIVVIASQWNINSDFRALLPESSEASRAMEEVDERVGSGSSLFVVIDSPDRQANREFARVYAEALREMPEVALAHFHNDKEFFEKRQLLYMAPGDIRALGDRIERQVREAKKKANPLYVSLDEEDDEEASSGLKTDDLEAKYDDLEYHRHKEYLESDDGYALTIVVRFVESSTDLVATNKLLDKVEKKGQDLNPTDYHSEMTVDYGGGLVNRQGEYTSILDDVQASAIFTVLGLFLVIALYFRRFRSVLFVLSPLIMAVLWTLAIAFAIFGELTTVTVFIFAILLGLGIDFSIHLLSGYNHRRAEGREPIEALVECYGTTGKATVIGALTTFVTFVVISFAQFRGLSQFGQVASIGVVCMLLAMVVVLPALILTLQRFRPHKPDAPGRMFLGRGLDRFYRWSMDKGVWVYVIAALALSAAALWQLPDLRFEENFRKIGQVEGPGGEKATSEEEAELDRAQRDARSVAGAIGDQALQVRSKVEPDTFERPREQKTLGDKYTSAVSGQQSSTPTLLLFDDLDEAKRVFRHMKQLHDDGELETVRAVSAIHAFMPGSQEEQRARMEEIEALDEILDESDLNVLDDGERERAERLEERVDVAPFDIYDLPDWSKRLFREAGPGAVEASEGESFAFEYLIYANEAIDTMNGAEARQFLEQLQQVRQELDADFRIGSQSYIYVAMLDELKRDGVVMISIALVLVFFLLSVAFGHPLRGLVALVPLLFGALWMFGTAAYIGLRLDFFNVIILPVVIGIGVDDGVHLYHHYLELGRGSIGEVMRKVGGAIAMTSITSAIGFGGLAVTDHDGLSSIGSLAIAGIIATFLSTVIIMPAILWLGEKYGIKWITGR